MFGIRTSLIVVGIIISMVILGLWSIKKFGPDNAVEQSAECVIELSTGQKIDLSPEDKTLLEEIKPLIQRVKEIENTKDSVPNSDNSPKP